MNTSNGPHAKRGWLRNGNTPGDPSKAPRCGANAKRTQEPCRAPAMSNGRCRLHGGKSTGPTSKDGLTRSREANWKTGHYSAETKARRYAAKRLLSEAISTLRKIRESS